jgi:hypothetical protein
MKRALCLLGAMVALASPAQAEGVKSTLSASNGVEVSLFADEFAGRYEYTAPTINFPNLSGFALVASVVQNGVAKPPEIVGSVMYNGEWRRYYSAILRGGESVDSTFNDRDVVSCRGSRYSGCSLREGFALRPTKAQIAKYAVDGKLQIQLRAQAGDAVLVDIPVSYIDAISEVAKAR